MTSSLNPFRGCTRSPEYLSEKREGEHSKDGRTCGSIFFFFFYVIFPVCQKAIDASWGLLIMTTYSWLLPGWTLLVLLSAGSSSLRLVPHHPDRDASFIIHTPIMVLQLYICRFCHDPNHRVKGLRRIGSRRPSVRMHKQSPHLYPIGWWKQGFLAPHLIVFVS